MAARWVCDLSCRVCGLFGGRFWVALALVFVMIMPVASFSAAHVTPVLAAAGCHQEILRGCSSHISEDYAAKSCDMTQMSCGNAGCGFIVSFESRPDGWQDRLSSVKLAYGDLGCLVGQTLSPDDRPPIL